MEKLGKQLEEFAKFCFGGNKYVLIGIVTIAFLVFCAPIMGWLPSIWVFPDDGVTRLRGCMFGDTTAMFFAIAAFFTQKNEYKPLGVALSVVVFILHLGVVLIATGGIPVGLGVMLTLVGIFHIVALLLTKESTAEEKALGCISRGTAVFAPLAMVVWLLTGAWLIFVG